FAQIDHAVALYDSQLCAATIRISDQLHRDLLSAHRRRCRRSPLRAHQFLDRRDSRAPGSVEQVAVGPMFDGVAPRVAPIVENLTPQDMAADAPFMLPSLLAKPVVPAHQIVEIRDFERGMIKLRLSDADQE